MVYKHDDKWTSCYDPISFSGLDFGRWKAYIDSGVTPNISRLVMGPYAREALDGVDVPFPIDVLKDTSDATEFISGFEDDGSRVRRISGDMKRSVMDIYGDIPIDKHSLLLAYFNCVYAVTDESGQNLFKRVSECDDHEYETISYAAGEALARLHNHGTADAVTSIDTYVVGDDDVIKRVDLHFPYIKPEEVGRARWAEYKELERFLDTFALLDGYESGLTTEMLESFWEM
jgi:hypothetical protein